MERLAELISKLKEQFEQKVDSSKLLATTLLIERELMKAETAQPPVAAGSVGSMITVVMPADRNGYHQRYHDALAEDERKIRPEPAVDTLQAARSESRKSPPPVPAFAEVGEPAEKKEFSRQAEPAAEEFSPKEQPAGVKELSRKTEPAEKKEFSRQAEPAAEEFSPKEQPVEANEVFRKTEPAKTKELSGKDRPAATDPLPEFIFDPLTEIPTLSQQHSVKEINEIIGIRDASLNDKLKEDKKEIGHILKEHPIRDLKKAIGVNDRYVFINELFRGDEVMYERSLKTINGFRIFAEAEYWIERELKVKLGWEEHKATTRLFYDLIRRRFS